MFKISTWRTGVRAASIGVFLLLLAFAHDGRLLGIPCNLYLRADPLAGALAPLAARDLIYGLWPAWLGLVSAFLFGRIFCGWICPMGATLDGAGYLARRFAPKSTFKLPEFLRGLKFLFLLICASAAFCGVNLFFCGSPIALVTRFYALALEPSLHWLYNFGVAVSEPLLPLFGGEGLLYGLEQPPFYYGLLFVAFFWLLLFGLEWLCPRFWCRYLCPAGALLALASRLKIFGRKLSGQCSRCGACSRKCPAGLLANPRQNSPGECLVCGNCVEACPTKALAFGLGQVGAHSPQISRRAFIGAAACGLALSFPLRAMAEASLVRPPGALPESEFLATCLRCGQCMAACPDNALQPALGGLAALFTPRLDPYSGGCLPECAACGRACPSGAIQPLSLEQKRWAKIGTALIDRNTCLAWHDDRRCMVCKENCPYNAIDVTAREGHIAPVPIVHENYCYGCGFCQKACPTAPASIIVGPNGALRLQDANFVREARARGLDFTPGRHLEEQGAGPPPGFLE